MRGKSWEMKVGGGIRYCKDYQILYSVMLVP
jgi:hypothetical protein